MPLFALGLNHHRAPLSIRERVAFQPEHVAGALHDLTRTGTVPEAAILSTCNRTELYVATASPHCAADWLARFHALPLEQIAPYLYTLDQPQTVRHVFRVASGLDSMVLGEAQILGQVKEAARKAQEAGTLGAHLHRLFQNTFSVAKEVRSNTAIGANIVSMAAAAVHLCERIFERIEDQHVLFIGAGEMIELCVAHFAGHQPKSISIANRTLPRAQSLAQRFGAHALELAALSERLPEYDVVVSCTGSPMPVLGLGTVERAVRARRHRPMVMVDLAVPRDIEPEAGQLDDVFLYTVDDLAQVVESGLESRQSAVQEAETIIEHRVQDFLHWLETREVVPTIRALRAHARQLQVQELQQAMRLLERGQAPERVLEAFGQTLVNKLLHGPTAYLSEAHGTQTAQACTLIKTLFRLEAEPGSETPPDLRAGPSR
jgi:glutamyl-tRNA reductase